MPPLKNRRREKFLNTYLTDPETKFNGKQSYLKVYKGVKDSTAEVESCRILSSPREMNRLSELLGEDDRTNALGIKKCINDLLEAKKPVIYDGEIVQEYPDNPTRLETIKFISKVQRFVDAGTESPGASNTFNMIFNSINEAEMAAVIGKVALLRSKLGHSVESIPVDNVAQ